MDIEMLKSELKELLQKELKTPNNRILTDSQLTSLIKFVDEGKVPSNELEQLHYYRGHSRIKRSSRIWELLNELKINLKNN